MRLSLRSFAPVFVAGAIVLACGSRTGLLSDEVPVTDASIDRDATIDVNPDGPIKEGGKLDVAVDCPEPPYCDPKDPGFVYQCGTRTIECSSLEQCFEGKCRNPCVDTLGQDTSNGCEFYAAEMDLTDEAAGVCYAVFIVNQWGTGEPARIQVDRGGVTLPIEQFARIPTGTGTSITYAPYSTQTGLAKDQVAVLFLSRDPAAANDPTPTNPRRLANCPNGVTPAVAADAAIHGTGKGQAFHIKTNVPVVAYNMLPYGAGRARVTGSTLLLPTNVWGDNYVAANAYRAPTLFSQPRAGPTMMILGQTDGTTVRIKPTVAILAGGGLAATPANATGTYVLNKGEYLQFTQPNELTGSAIQSSAPVAVIGGATLYDVPTSIIRADSGHQMLPPVRALGSEYVGVRYRSRGIGEESVPWRVVGVVAGTQLTWEPSVPPGAPTTLGPGQLVEWSSPGEFVVRSQDAQHPFYLAQYMSGGQPFDGAGDPEFVNAPTPAQYLPRYTFFTDPTYPETNLVIVRQKDAQSGDFPDVVLDCAGTLGGWKNLGTQGKYQFTRVDLSTGNFQGIGSCNNGVHTIVGQLPNSGTARFGVTVWGWGNGVTWPGPEEDNPRFTRWVSYGYPAGANITTLNGVVFPAQ
jgi:hypothetical protein